MHCSTMQLGFMKESVMLLMSQEHSCSAQAKSMRQICKCKRKIEFDYIARGKLGLKPK